MFLSRLDPTAESLFTMFISHEGDAIGYKTDLLSQLSMHAENVEKAHHIAHDTEEPQEQPIDSGPDTPLGVDSWEGNDAEILPIEDHIAETSVDDHPVEYEDTGASSVTLSPSLTISQGFLGQSGSYGRLSCNHQVAAGIC